MNGRLVVCEGDVDSKMPSLSNEEMGQSRHLDSPPLKLLHFPQRNNQFRTGGVVQVKPRP
jgi:hypothetical protein